MFEDMRFLFSFGQRPVAIPADLRATWKIGVLSLVLHNCCRQSRSSLAKLHIVNSMFYSENTAVAVSEALAGNPPMFPLAIRVEPAVNRAIDLAAGMNLVLRAASGRIELTDRGTRMARALDTSHVYEREKGILRTLGRSLTERMVLDLLKGAT
jgi:hypothetical protein